MLLQDGVWLDRKGTIYDVFNCGVQIFADGSRANSQRYRLLFTCLFGFRANSTRNSDGAVQWAHQWIDN
eukprot:m.1644538 g.1644538  ORF g.1644538 m.1644538 type:complete len:69 (-) comp63427_c0_seq1:69-275(-)